MAGTSGPFTPRQLDHETMALVVTCYRVLDAYLLMTGSLAQASTRFQRSSHSRGPHVVDDWVGLAISFAQLMKLEGAGTVESDGSSNSLPSLRTSPASALLKKMVGSGRNAAVWRIFSNVYSCATFLVSLCDPASIQVRSSIHFEGSFL